MTTAIERLRASKEEAEKEEGEAGKADGRSWAEQRATYKELRRVSEIQDGCFDYSNLKRAIDPDDDVVMSDFMEKVFGVDDEPTDEYIEGFIEGAQDFFAEVRDQL